jgi:hypothetical protein
MAPSDRVHCTAFTGCRRVASGELAEVASKVKAAIDGGDAETVLIFDDHTSELVEVDFRGTVEDVLKRLPQRTEPDALASQFPQSPRGPGRPKLGVVAREVTLLPRHWEWLNSQPGGASVALRKLVEQARRDNQDRDRVRHAQEAAYRFMSAMAGDLVDFEEATRALFAGNRERFHAMIGSWPTDIRDHAGNLAAGAWEQA